MSKQLTFDLFSDKYAWTKCDHKNNDFTVGYFTANGICINGS